MQIAGFVAMSHAPYWDLKAIHDAPGEHFVEAVSRAHEAVAAHRPDALVVVGPDHFRNFFFDAMPPFCIGIEQVEAIGDYHCPKGPVPVVPEWARSIAHEVGGSGFDPAVSLNMGIDHGISQAYAALARELEIPLIPIMVNCSGAGSATLRRCHEFGRAVGRAIRAAPFDGRVVVVGSGGLSHSPATGSPYDPDIAAERRDYIVNGRSRREEFTARMNALLASRTKDRATGNVNVAWDEWFLRCLASNDLEPLLALTDEEILRDGGVGGHEVRGWITALGAWDRPIAWTAYEPVPTWITGMGVAVG